MNHELPPLNPLRVFESAARHLNFTAAAQELHITQGAVSHQIKALEIWLGFELFDRSTRRLRLTRGGEAYAHQLNGVFARIVQATQDLMVSSSHQILTVRGHTTFFVRWLIPFLPRFQAAHPDIRVKLSANVEGVDFRREQADVGIVYGDGAWGGAAERSTVHRSAYARDGARVGRAFTSGVRNRGIACVAAAAFESAAAALARVDRGYRRHAHARRGRHVLRRFEHRLPVRHRRVGRGARTTAVSGKGTRAGAVGRAASLCADAFPRVLPCVPRRSCRGTESCAFPAMAVGAVDGRRRLENCFDLNLTLTSTPVPVIRG
jgi:DNA-binding transcriptional LysR family regulator